MSIYDIPLYNISHVCLQQFLSVPIKHKTFHELVKFKPSSHPKHTHTHNQKR
jgi:hypothetical protein